MDQNYEMAECHKYRITKYLIALLAYRTLNTQVFMTKKMLALW